MKWREQNESNAMRMTRVEHGFECPRQARVLKEGMGVLCPEYTWPSTASSV